MVNEAHCIHCERTEDQVPLMAFRYRDEEAWICPQHLPILIHRPAQLSDKLPGAENFPPSEGHGH